MAKNVDDKCNTFEPHSGSSFSLDFPKTSKETIYRLSAFIGVLFRKEKHGSKHEIKGLILRRERVPGIQVSQGFSMHLCHHVVRLFRNSIGSSRIYFAISEVLGS